MFGGASRSLLETIAGFPHKTIKAHLVSQRGDVSTIFHESNVEVIDTFGISQIDHTKFGFYRNARWLILIREVFFLPFTFLGLWKAKKKWPKIDIVHVNEITNIPSILIAKFLFKCPIFVHVRSVQENNIGKIRLKIRNRILSMVAQVIAIDSTVRCSLPDHINVKVIHNGFNVKRQNEIKPSPVNLSSSRPLRLLFVGGFIPMKGLVNLVHAVKLCKDNNLNIHVVVCGDLEERFSSLKADFLKKLGLYFDVKPYCKDYISCNSMDKFFTFVDFIRDIESVYIESDVLCFPSHLNAVGRPVIEAALLSKPSIVYLNSADNKNDVIINKETGICIEDQSIDALYNAIKFFHDNPEEISKMGANALKLAEKNFNIKKNSKIILNMYNCAVSEFSHAEKDGGKF